MTTSQANSVSRELLDLSARRDGGPIRYWTRLTQALSADLADSGIAPESMVLERRIELSGGYGIGWRNWDVVVFDEDLPVVLI